MAIEKEKYGQYMTPKLIAEFMTSLITHNKDALILEPSSGEGIFIDTLKQNGFNNIDACEIDKDIIRHDNVRNSSFISEDFENNYDVIIGNPPYIRWKNLEEELKKELEDNLLWSKYLNRLNDYSSIFILKSIELLNEGGELIFITPEYWLNTTQSANLRNYMLSKGYITDIFIFKETPIFEKVSVSLIVFRFVKKQTIIDKPDINIYKYNRRDRISATDLANMKNKLNNNDIEYFTVPHFSTDDVWLIAKDDVVHQLQTYESHCKKLLSNDYHVLEDYCEIGNGMVSGLDKAFQLNGVNLNNDENTSKITVIKGKDLSPFIHNGTTEYMFINHVSSESVLIEKYPNYYAHLQKYKDQLLDRYSYNRDINYWEWVFLRNYNLFSRQVSKIFVPCKERITNKDYFRFALVDDGVYPTQDVTAIIPKPETQESIEYIAALLNSKFVFNWLMYNGIVKGNIVEFSRKPVASIPFRPIDFTNNFEREVHDNIVTWVRQYKLNPTKSNYKMIFDEINKLF